MASAYAGNPANTPATITVIDDGDPVNAAATTNPLKDLADLVANARLNAAKTNVDNHFTAIQSLIALLVSGSSAFAGSVQLNGGRFQTTPNPFAGTRVKVDQYGNAGNGLPFARTYINLSSDFEIVINGNWNEGASSWDRDQTGSPTIKYILGAYGLQAFYYSGAAASVVEGSGWTKSLDLRWPYSSGSVHPVGAVLGLINDHDAAFSMAPISNAIAAALAYVLKTIPGDVAFGGDWANAGSTGRAAAFFKDAFGVVHLEGQISTATGGGTANPAFTLPAGYRPSAPINVLASCVSGGSGGFNRVTLNVSSGGVVTMLYEAYATGAISRASLESITFRADA